MSALLLEEGANFVILQFGQCSPALSRAIKILNVETIKISCRAVIKTDEVSSKSDFVVD